MKNSQDGNRFSSEEFTKNQLLQIVPIKDYEKYVVDQLVANCGHSVLKTPALFFNIELNRVNLDAIEN